MSPDLTRPERLLLGLLLGLTAAGRLAVAFADHLSLVNTEVYSDDAFYYLRLAQNVAAGRGLTFDGVSVTNGFQPLYLGLLVAIFKLAPAGDLAFPVHASAVLLGLAAVATGWVLFRLAARLGSARSGLAVLGLWAVCPYFIVHGINGLETGLGLFFAALVLDLYHLWFRDEPAVPLRRCVLMGLACGLGILARIDLLVLLAALAVDSALRGQVWRRLGRMALVGLVLALAWLPWGLISHAATGYWLPLSGAASRQIALQVGSAIDLPHVWSVPGSNPFFDPEHPPAAYYGDVLSKMVLLFLLESPLLAPLRWSLPFSIWPDVRPYAPFIGLTKSPALGAALLALALVLFALRRPKGLGRVVLIYGVLFAVGYTFYCPAHWYYSRYLTTLVLISTTAVLARRPMRWPLALAFGLALLVQLKGLSFYRWFDWTEPPPQGRLARWIELQPKLDRSGRIGSFQAGLFSYFSGLDIIDLDGKVNQDAAQALRERRLARYIYQQDIRSIVEWEWLFFALCLRHTRISELALERVDRGRGPFDLTLYRVLPLSSP